MQDSGADLLFLQRQMRQPKIITTLRAYDGGQALADGLAGNTVAMVAIPLSLVIAIASGAAPERGLVAANVAVVIAAHDYDRLVAATFIVRVAVALAPALRPRD